MAYHVFISYRRDGGFPIAQLLCDRLRADGYSPFFDVEEMRSGPFNEQLYERIEECSDFLLILPPGALDPRPEEREDWVRLELAHALKCGKNVIPFMLRDFSFPDDLPEEIDRVRYQQGLVASQDYFDATYARLKSLLCCDLQAIAEEQAWQAHRQEVARRKAERIQTVRYLFTFAALLLVLTALAFLINFLTSGLSNALLDRLLSLSDGQSAAEIAALPLAAQFAFALVPVFMCLRLFLKGVDIDSPVLMGLSAVLYLLSAFFLQLAPAIVAAAFALYFAFHLFF